MTTETLTNLPAAPSAGAPAANEPGAAGVGTLDQAADRQSDPELDDEGQPIQAEPETEEVEHEGQKFKIPKVLKPALLMQADYTRKTQEHAEKVREDEARLAQAQQELTVRDQVQRSLVGEYAQLAAMDQQLQPYAKVNWQQAMSQDPQAAQAAWMTFQQLKEQRAGVASKLQTLESQRTQELHSVTQRKLEDAARRVSSEIPSWSPELAGKLKAAGRDVYGFSEVELSQIQDPRAVRLLHDAFQYQQLIKRTGAAPTQRAAPAQATTAGTIPAAPVPAATLPAGGSGNVKTLEDRSISTDEWMRRRSQQLKKRGK